MRALLFVLAVGLLLLMQGGCAAEGNSSIMEMWRGHSATELVSSWGEPDHRFANDEQGQVLVYIDPKNLAGATKESLAGDPEALAISASYFESEADMLAHMPPALKILQPPYRAFWVNRDGTIYRWAWKGL